MLYKANLRYKLYFYLLIMTSGVSVSKLYFMQRYNDLYIISEVLSKFVCKDQNARENLNVDGWYRRSRDLKN